MIQNQRSQYHDHGIPSHGLNHRNHDQFRHQDYKANLWTKIGEQMNLNGTACKDAFKAIREKYIREREKHQHYGDQYKPWYLLDYLKFLDPHIVSRKLIGSWDMQSEQMCIIKRDPCADDEDLFEITNDTGDGSQHIFSRALIKLVYGARAIWDRHCVNYHNKSFKDQLWTTMAQTLNSDVNTCTLRWKALREKYIRQKQKFPGDTRWELLDDLAFLDSVIQYRKRQWHTEELSNIFTTNDNSSTYSQSNFDCETDEKTNDSIRSPPPTTTGIVPSIPDNSNPLSSSVSLNLSMPDSTLDGSNQLGRKRTFSDTSEPIVHKKDKNDEQSRTPEQIFGELVAAMLASKSEQQKNTAMMEIMAILAKPS